MYRGKRESKLQQKLTTWGVSSHLPSRRPWISQGREVHQVGWLLCHWKNMVFLSTRVPLQMPWPWGMGGPPLEPQPAVLVEPTLPWNTCSPVHGEVSPQSVITKSETLPQIYWAKSAMTSGLSQTCRSWALRSCLDVPPTPPMGPDWTSPSMVFGEGDSSGPFWMLGCSIPTLLPTGIPPLRNASEGTSWRKRGPILNV